MEINKNEKGFTLIELIVVVLIIGILSVIALPQYQKSVQIAKMKRIMPLMRSVYDAQQRHYLHYGKYASRWELLDISIPGSKVSTTAENLETITAPNFSSITLYDSGATQFRSKELPTFSISPLNGKNIPIYRICCSNDRKYICEALNFIQTGQVSSSGTQYECHWYEKK